MTMDCNAAEAALCAALQSNPGPWGDHSRYVAQACEVIAYYCGGLDPNDAYCYGLLHDIGRYAGVSSERHLIDGYTYCMARGWEKAAQICISHAFMIQDIYTSIGVFDVTKEEYEFMEKFIKEAVYDDYDLLVQLCDGLAICPPAFAFWKSGSWMWRFDTGRTPVQLPAGNGHWRLRLILKTRSDARSMTFSRALWKIRFSRNEVRRTICAQI